MKGTKKTVIFSALAERIAVLFERFQSAEHYDRSLQHCRELHCGEDARTILHRKLVATISNCLFLLSICLVFSIILVLSTYLNPVLHEGNKLRRPSTDSAETSVTLQYETDDTPEQDISFSLSEQRFSGKELDDMFLLAIAYAEEAVRGSNTSLEAIETDISFPRSFRNTAFRFTWEPQSYLYLTPNGYRTTRELPPEGIIEVLTVTIDYYDEQQIHSFPIRLLKKAVPKETLFRTQLAEELDSINESTATEAWFTLPSSIEGTDLQWQEKSTSSPFYFIVLGVTGALLLFFGERKKTEKEVKAREQQLLLDYPGLITRFMLLLNAGATTRAAWSRLTEDYKQHASSRYLTKEMSLTNHELTFGVSEERALESFGKRCRLLPYLRFSTILVQNLKKGAKGTLPQLEYEAAEAFSERKALAKRLGEEAGTKLLLPMIGMLAVVMIIILIPAFQTL